jgi:hypothetical protein
MVAMGARDLGCQIRRKVRTQHDVTGIATIYYAWALFVRIKRGLKRNHSQSPLCS